jgi:hypothetical protein
MKHYFPDSRRDNPFLQTNRSNIQGTLWSTFATDFQTNKGVIKASQKLVTNTTSSDDADLGCPCAFQYFDDRWFAICGTRVFKSASDLLTATFAEDASTGFQTNYDFNLSDLEIFDNRLWSSTATTLYSKAAGSGTGTWSSRRTFASAAGVHKLAYLKKFNRLYFVDDLATVCSIDTANAVATTGSDYAIDLGTSTGLVTTIVPNSQFMWIGITQPSNSSNDRKLNGAIAKWDGISAQLTEEFALEAAGCLAMTVDNDVPYAIDSEGRILKYTGYSFEEIARLPVDKLTLTGATAATTTNGRFVHVNGFTATKNNTLQVLINNLNSDSGATINENLPSGIWELDLETLSFTHRYTPTLKTSASSTITDFGQNRILTAGALKLNTLTNATSSGRSTLICGFNYYTDATTTKSGIFIDSPARADTDLEGQKKAYFVTTWFTASEIEDKWLELWSVHKRFATATDSIRYKYRFIEEAPTYATITWVNTTSFTTTTDITAYGPTATGFDGTTGGEFEGIQGTGSGATAHITNIVNNAGTYTVTLDTAITGVTTGTAKARFQKWIPLPSMTDDVKSFGNTVIGKLGTRIQIKGCLTFTGDGEFHKFIMVSQENFKIE